MSFRHGRLKIGLVCLAAAVAGGLAFAVASSTDRQAAAGGAQGKPAPPFALLRESAPTQAAAERGPFGSGHAGALGVDLATARTTTVGARTYWAATGGSKVCVSVSSRFESGGTFGACASWQDASSDGVIVTSQPSPDAIAKNGLDPATTELAALLPDGVDEVAVTLSDGTTTNAQVTDNTTALVASRAPVSLRFTSGSGPHVVHLNRNSG